MNFMVRSLAALMWLIAFALVSTPAAAQEPELRAHADVQVGLWKTPYISPTGATMIYAGSAEEACQIQHQSFNPLATYVGVEGDGELVRGCKWIRYLDGGPVGSNPTLGTAVYFECPYGYYVRGGLCILGHVKPSIPCDDGCGAQAKSASPKINVADPISINSGLKVLSETDYETADGLLSVDRQYSSSLGVGVRLISTPVVEELTNL